jgi:hypothetical protein
MFDHLLTKKETTMMPGYDRRYGPEIPNASEFMLPFKTAVIEGHVGSFRPLAAARWQ